VGELVRFARSKEKRIARTDFGPTIFVANLSATGDNLIHLGLARVRMIRTINLTFWNPDQREIKRPPLHQIKRLLSPSMRDRNIFREPAVFALRRLPLLLLHVFNVYLAHC